MQSTATVAEWAREIGFDRNTLMARVVEMGIQPVGKITGGKAAGADTYRIRDLFKAALGGDMEAERLRKTREEADKLALQNARSRGETIEVAAVKKLGEAVFVQIRNKILSFPITAEEQDALLKLLLDLRKIDWDREAAKMP
jgi:phage terminase Nu1 subunit (DNA packaging protein)